MKISIEQSRWAILCDAAEIMGRAEARIANLERLMMSDARADARIAELATAITVRDTEIARLETDLKSALRRAGLSDQIERAANLLPNGYLIQLTVENGAATVEMFDGEDWTHIERDSATLADEVSEAIDAARGEP